MSVSNIYVDCGTSPNAVKAAIGALEALGGKNGLNEASLKDIRQKQEEGIAQGICMYSYGTISYSDTKWFEKNNSWIKAGDLSTLTYSGPFKVVEIVLNHRWVATVGENYTEVGCQVIQNDNVLKVAEAIEQINKTKGQ